MNNSKELERKFLRILKKEIHDRYEKYIACTNSSDELMKILSTMKMNSLRSSLIQYWFIEILEEIKWFGDLERKKLEVKNNMLIDAFYRSLPDNEMLMLEAEALRALDREKIKFDFKIRLRFKIREIVKENYKENFKSWRQKNLRKHD